MATISYLPVDRETDEMRANGKEFPDHADAYIAALTDGVGTLERDGNGIMHVVENERLLFAEGSANPDDQTAKNDVICQIVRHLWRSEFRYSTLKVERDEEGNIVKIDDLDEARLLSHWKRRIG
jgi:hypothetical protein